MRAAETLLLTLHVFIFYNLIYKNWYVQIYPRLWKSLGSKRSTYDPIIWSMKIMLCQSEDPELFSIQRNIPWPLARAKLKLIKTLEYKLFCNTNIVLFEPVCSDDWITLSERKALQPLCVSQSSPHLKLPWLQHHNNGNRDTQIKWRRLLLVSLNSHNKIK